MRALSKGGLRVFVAMRPSYLLQIGQCSTEVGDLKLQELLNKTATQIGMSNVRQELAGYDDILRKNWFDVDSLNQLSAEDCAALGLPMRLITEAAQASISTQLGEDVCAEDIPAQKEEQAPISAKLANFGDIAVRAPLRSKGFGSSKSVRVTKRRRKTSCRYRLTDAELERAGTNFIVTGSSGRSSSSGNVLNVLDEQDVYGVRDEFKLFEEFLTMRFLGQQEPRMQPVTAEAYIRYAKGALGWLHHEKHVPLEQLSLRLLFPDSSRSGVSTIYEHLLWLQTERGVTASTETFATRAFVSMAKFLFHPQSQTDPTEGDKPYADLGVVTELRKLGQDARNRWRVATSVANESEKWLDWHEYMRCTKVLLQECAGRRSCGTVRSDRTIAWSVQMYLVFSLLACVPDRQRTLRELEVGRTLFHPDTDDQTEDSCWWIKHNAADYKTGKDYGDRPALLINPSLTPALLAWHSRWRAALNPQHDFFFSQKNGQPLSAQSLYEMFSNTAYRITGKKTNPHLVRDMVVTHLRGSDASEQELEALAIFMGHSVHTQKTSYDKRTMAQKVAPAVSLLQRLNST